MRQGPTTRSQFAARSIILRSSAPELSNDIIKNGLAFRTWDAESSAARPDVPGGRPLRLAPYQPRSNRTAASIIISIRSRLSSRARRLWAN
jgi:hypothetical protein